MMVGGRERRERREHSAPVLIAVIIFLSAAVGALLARRMDAPDFSTISTSTPEFPTCEKGDTGAKGETGPVGPRCEYLSVVPKRTEHAPNLAWLCPLCACSTGTVCDAIHARATKLITNFHAACTLCPAESAESETAESILESTKADIFFLDVAYPFRAIDTCSGKPVHSCVLCDNVTGITPNCGVDNLGKMRDLHVTARRDMACRSNHQTECACVHAEELTPVSWSECAAIVDHNNDSENREEADRADRASSTRLNALSRSVRYLKHIWDPVCAYGKGENTVCLPSRFYDPKPHDPYSKKVLGLVSDALGTMSVASAIAKFYSSDKHAAGHAAIKAVCSARGAGTTCGGLLARAAQTKIERAMLVPFGPITSEGDWIDPVTLFSV